jgi:multiple sugar transport system permease protein
MTTAEIATGARGDRRVRQGTRAGTITTNVVLAVATLYALLPLMWLLLASTKNAEALFGSNLLDFANSDFVGNVRALIAEEDGIYLRWYGNSLLYAVIGAAVGAFVSTAAGYVFDKYEFRGKRQFYALVLISVMIPGTVLALPMYLIASQLGLANTMWAVFVTVLFNPFGVYLARIFATGYVPGEVLEAARVDGASELHIFFRIGLRMLGPGFVTVFLFQLTSIWNNFFLPLVMLSDETLYPLSLGLYSWNSSATITPEYYPLVVIGSLLALLPLVVAFLMLQRYWKSGLTAGSVK